MISNMFQGSLKLLAQGFHTVDSNMLIRKLEHNCVRGVTTEAVSYHA